MPIIKTIAFNDLTKTMTGEKRKINTFDVIVTD